MPLKAGLILLDPATGTVLRRIALQYNPDSLSRTLQLQTTGGESTDRSEAMRLRGMPVETFKLEADIDATDALSAPDANREVVAHGIHPQLAVLERLVYPTSDSVLANDALAARGAFEILAAEAPLVLLVWGRNRVVPVRLTEFSVTEEAFDASLNPIRARVSLGLRVLSVDDMGLAHKAGGIFMTYLRNRESLAAGVRTVSPAVLGVGDAP